MAVPSGFIFFLNFSLCKCLLLDSRLHLSAQRLTASASAASSVEVTSDPFAMEAKYFTELRVLNRDVRIVLEGVDKFNNLIGSVYYSDGDTVKDLGLELIEFRSC
ncbi:hypothetical protein AALP_AA6G219700 [Arabis alpina]|uniref:TNase-like domain-containing protein n=1 Tax=Arabis alpina TaxID=50452 RepID=A0A087GQW2_ARAAL|nr:hypothetical protein AALP_AA6G219700 [Arabis alpina]